MINIGKEIFTSMLNKLCCIKPRVQNAWRSVCQYLRNLFLKIQPWNNPIKFSNKKIQHEIIKAINTGDVRQADPFGNIMLDKLLTPQGYAIFIDEKNNRIALLQHYNRKLYPCSDAKMVRTIFDMLTLIQSLSKDRSTYSINPAYGCNRLLCNGADDLRPLEDGIKYKISEVLVLVLENNEWKIKAGNETLYKECFSFENEVHDQLKACLDSLFYPTEGLVTYINHNYQSQHEYDTEISLKRAKKANIIALVVGISALVVAPILNTCVNDFLGGTKLKVEQFDSIMSKKEKIFVIKDTIFVHKLDTIRCVIIKDETKQLPKKKKNE